ncbi:MAG: hypothetical protein EOS30_21505 [Mesorhizobium sp.]|nr:hypothetical protein EN746_08435 [Mesorhizobium sp. M8A.F.Ca.ET.023.02.2.1]RWC69870.1 MAG: hypothetical protein EOS30_21505 [Mesorhizobium sp.]
MQHGDLFVARQAGCTESGEWRYSPALQHNLAFQAFGSKQILFGGRFAAGLNRSLGYRFNERFSALAGYRALGVNYSNNGFEFDVVQQGPIMGLVMHF